ncbi:MAG: small multi-drug export protein [Candidatus Jorgensenbacteria bacterium]
MNAELTTIAIAASPFFELRGAIPLGIFAFGLPPLEAYVLGVIGSFLPVLPLLFFWNFIYEKITHHFYFPNRFFSWLFERTRRKHENHFEVWKEIGLMLFVGIPVPFTGAWSGTVAAFVFGIPMKQAAVMIFLGNVISGAIVLLLSGAVSFAL